MRRRKGQWYQPHPSGARVLAGAPGMTHAQASATLAWLRPAVGQRDASSCACGDCLRCELAALRARRAAAG